MTDSQQKPSSGGFSLQRRLRWGISAMLLVVFIALWLAASFTIHALVEHYLVTRLQHDADMLVTQLQHENGHWQLDNQSLNPIYRQPNSGHYFVVEVDDQRLASPSLGGYPLWTPRHPPENPYETPAPAMGETATENPTPALEPVLVHFQQETIDGHPVRLYVAEDHTPIQNYLLWFDAIFAAVALLVLVLTAGLTQRLVRRGFASLNPLEKQLQSFSRGDGTFKQPAGLPIEITPLANALQHSLGLLQEQLKRYRHANADLAHAMKTPLHVIFQQLNDPELQQHPALQKRIKQQAERLRALLERELAQARVAGNTWQADAFEFPVHVHELRDALQQLHPHIRIHLQTEGTGQALPIEKEDGFELLGTLLDNACKWAKNTVRLSLQRESKGIWLCVDDDGPGVAPEEYNQLIQRGHRLDENTPGTGLGLAIATDIINRYSGKLRINQSPMGGLRVCAWLPLDAWHAPGST